MSDLPIYHFERPPVVETVLGVQFEPLPNLMNAHLGAFWRSMDGEWPRVSDVPPIEQQFEMFGSRNDSLRRGILLKFSNTPAQRLQIMNEEGDRMVQIQNGRIHYNWRRQTGADYPLFSGVKPEFLRHLESFKEFLAEEDLGELAANQWELTYVNQIPKGELWESVGEWGNILRPLSLVDMASVELESLDAAWHFVIPPVEGRIHVEVSRRPGDGGSETDSLLMKLTARGPVSDRDPIAGLDLGRQHLDNTFWNLTTEAAHQHWGATNANS
ncbi:MAG: TIGR04255 family protein [Planctomycetota bacterium]|nr:TIGR04255 family protein [Planctomycetota bacterium]